MEEDHLKLSLLEEELYKMAKRKGYITFQHTSVLWVSPYLQKAHLIRFVEAGILKETNIHGRFDYNAT